MQSDVVSFVHLSDTHIGPTKAFARHGFLSYSALERVVTAVNSLPIKPNFIIHTGDVATDPDPAAYRLAAEALAKLRVPVYFVNGNHDDAGMIREFLPMGPKVEWFSGETTLAYHFDVSGYRFVVLDGKGPVELDPAGQISEAQLIRLRQICAEGDMPLVVFVHFPLLPVYSTWFDENMLVVNGRSVHEVLRTAQSRLRGVFLGHIHQSMQTVCDGVMYTAVPSTFAQFIAWPQAQAPAENPAYPPGFNLVHLLPEQTIVQQHVVNRYGKN
ncbi:MAG: phosphodiesterase [Candidatus Promineifilaceae bacterium]